MPVAQLIRRTLSDIEPHARELGADRELEGISDILANGNGADRQLRVFNANRDIVEVTREIADATEAGRQSRRDRRRRTDPGRLRLALDLRDRSACASSPARSPYVLLFYLFDWSSTCTDEFSHLGQPPRECSSDAGVTSYGISRDSPWSHVAWAQALDLDVPLLSDWNGEAVGAFGVVQEYRGMHDVAGGAAFVVDGEGIIRGAWRYGAAEVPDFDSSRPPPARSRSGSLRAAALVATWPAMARLRQRVHGERRRAATGSPGRRPPPEPSTASGSSATSWRTAQRPG